MLSPVSCDYLITAVLTRSGNGRNENAVFFDALDRLRHSFIVPHTEWMVGEWVKLTQRDFFNRIFHFYLQILRKDKGAHCLLRSQ